MNDIPRHPWRRRALALAACALALAGGPARAVVTTPIDLNDFGYADPTVTIAADGSSATMTEDVDPSFGPLTVLLENDPNFDSPVIVPGPDRFVVFDYDFTGTTAGSYSFAASLFDATSYVALPGADDGSSAFGTGLGEIDLAPFAGSGLSIGMQFLLSPEASALASDRTTLVISNLRLEDRGATVPEPPVAALLVLAIAALRARRPPPA